MTINTAMLVGLGFLIATLLAVLIAPAYRQRIVRLTTDALKRSLPLTEAEMRADKDRLRAEHAIRVHNLEAKLESVTLSSARQNIEVNRRDARISELEGIVGEQKTQIEELENARRVLEQTVTDRLPKIESRLTEARKLLSQRDSEIATLAETAQKQARAIAEATQINVQQTSEIERLNSALATRAARNQDGLGDARFDGEVALRSEIDALRAKTRDQMALIASLQSLLASPETAAAPETIAAVTGALGAVNTAAEVEARAQAERLTAELDELHGALRQARASADAERAGSTASDGELRQLRAANQDMTAEVARLKAAVGAYEAADTDKKVKDSPIAMKAKVSALEAQAREQATTIASLRAEASAINERLARQANHYMEEMKRLGAGTLPASGEARRARPEAAKRSLSERINDPRVVHLNPADKRADTDPAEPPALPALPAPPARAPLFSLTDQPAATAPATPAPVTHLDVAAMAAGAANDITGAPSESATSKLQAAAAPRRPRLLERITSIEKPGSN